MGGLDSRSTPAPECRASQAVRYIPKSIKHTVWMRDRGTCVKCGSLRNLQYDHIHPVSLGGGSTVENVRLLCFSCNQRRAIQTFGIRTPVGVKPDLRQPGLSTSG